VILKENMKNCYVTQKKSAQNSYQGLQNTLKNMENRKCSPIEQMFEEIRYGITNAKMINKLLGKK
jgi:hypothetical protein